MSTLYDEVPPMPELPEVETTRRGIEPHVTGSTIEQLVVRNPKLRWPVPRDLAEHLVGDQFNAIERRGKYLLFKTAKGTLLGHLGMSGSMRICSREADIKKHDHIDIVFANGQVLRYHDPRRFGFLLWTEDDPLLHERLIKLGPEPLSDDFTGDHLHQLSRKRSVAVKNFIMDSHTVVGVGNIYASESLFLAGIRPTRAANRVSKKDYNHLAEHIRIVLDRSIQQGGTTLKDFVNSDGQPGYFAQQLNVYGRSGEPCRHCGTTIKNKVIGQRASYYCPQCQS